MSRLSDVGISRREQQQPPVKEPAFLQIGSPDPWTGPTARARRPPSLRAGWPSRSGPRFPRRHPARLVELEQPRRPEPACRAPTAPRGGARLAPDSRLLVAPSGRVRAGRRAWCLSSAWRRRRGQPAARRRAPRPTPDHPPPLHCRLPCRRLGPAGEPRGFAGGRPRDRPRTPPPAPSRSGSAVNPPESGSRRASARRRSGPSAWRVSCRSVNQGEHQPGPRSGGEVRPPRDGRGARRPPGSGRDH